MKLRFVDGAVLCGALAAGGTAGSTPAGAAGFALFEQSARSVGLAGACTAQAEDPSAIFHNAGAIAFLKGRQAALGTSFFSVGIDFAGADPFPGRGRRDRMHVAVPIPMAYYTQSVGRKAVAGIGIDAPFGLKTQWDAPDFSGRYISRLAELTAISINPTLAYAVSERFAVGAGLDLRLTKVALERVVPLQSPLTGEVLDVATARLDSDTGLAAGFNAGVLARPTERLSIGLAYRHRVTAQLQGRARFTPRATGDARIDGLVATFLPGGDVPLRTSLAFPAIASLGIAHRFGRWTAEADVNWYQWSRFQRVQLDFEGRPDLDQTILEEYTNTLQYRFGVERVLGPRWTLRAGYYFDNSPAPAASVSPLLPDPDRHCVAAGLSWTRGRMRLDGAGQLVMGRDRSTEGVNRDGFNGVYSNTGFVLSAFVGYRF